MMLLFNNIEELNQFCSSKINDRTSSKQATLKLLSWLIYNKCFPIDAERYAMSRLSTEEESALKIGIEIGMMLANDKAERYVAY